MLIVQKYFDIYQEFVPELLAPAGQLTVLQPMPQDWASIKLGWNVTALIRRQDKGQSVVVQNDTVLGLEDKEGTNALMEKAASFKQVIGRGPILVKTCVSSRIKLSISQVLA